MYDVIVIGGGAAGMFASVTAANAGRSVLLLEKNERLGKKLNITGKGRCNVTNNCTPEEVLKNIPRNSRFLFSVMNSFSPRDTMDFFEAHGCALKTERGNRVFPVSDKAISVINALKGAMREANVKLKQTSALQILTRDGAVCGVHTSCGDEAARRVILCTGGCSYPATGSTGDGYGMARALGHTIIEPVGSLVPMESKDEWCARMQGLSLRNVNVRLTDEKGKLVHEEFGELLFTHFGLSGPTILSMSAHMRKGSAYTVSIDLKPALDEKKLDARILRDFSENQNRNFENALSGLFHKTMIPVIVARSGIDPTIKVHEITRQQRRTLLELTKRFTVEIEGLRPVEEAIITSGGIATKEINPKTMESKLVSGLYFAGEVIDCDAYTGGFNLQIAWASAHAAASAAVL